MADPPVLNTKINPGTVVTPGHGELERLINVGLGIVDSQGVVRGQLGETVPTVENGLWKVQPDGRMETSWRIKPNAEWHDGTPFTAQDVLFTAVVEQDRELPIRRDVAYDWIEAFEAPDPQTVVVRWKRPYIQADQLLNSSTVLPRHLLERSYLEDKPSFAQATFWNQDFVGTGPFKLKEWIRGSHVILVANDRYVLGRPKIDEIEVRFIPDTNTLMANVLSGTVHLTMGRGLSTDQSVQIRDQWSEGKLDLPLRSWVVLYPQFVNPSPTVIGDVRFRKALMHAINRQDMVDTIQAGLASVAHAYLTPTEAEYKDVEGSAVRYDYDTRRAIQMIQEIGYMQGTDGGFRDASGQRLTLEPWTTSETDIHLKTIFPVADFWQRIGIAVEPQVLPQQRAQDRAYRAQFPAFLLWRQPNDPFSISRHHSSQAPLPENNFVGTNNARYINAEWDGLIDRYLTTIPRAERNQVLAQAVRHVTDQLNIMGLFYDTEPTLIWNRLQYAAGSSLQGSSLAWNAEQWEIR
jgi:peptide/nickel transport system substrate-binding protein